MSQASASQPVVDEQRLSQQLQLLSPFRQPAPTAVMKGMDFDITPHYLAEDDPTLENTLRSLAEPCLPLLNKLRPIAILMHKIQCIELVRMLWLIYRQSGTGNLPTPFPIDRSEAKIWPEEVRSVALSQTDSWTMDVDEDDPCLSFVDEQLGELLGHLARYELILQAKQRSLAEYTPTIDGELRKMVHRGLEFQRMEIALHRDMVEYDFIDTLLKRHYEALELNPQQVCPDATPSTTRPIVLFSVTPFQKKLGKRLLKLKFQAIKTQYEHDFVKEKVKTHLSVRDVPRFTTVPEVYQNLANEAREQMMALYVECAERQMRQAALDFDQLLAQSIHVDERLPPSMFHVLDQRFDLIHAKVARHYQSRTELLRYHQKNLTWTAL